MATSFDYKRRREARPSLRLLKEGGMGGHLCLYLREEGWGGRVEDVGESITCGSARGEGLPRRSNRAADSLTRSYEVRS